MLVLFIFSCTETGNLQYAEALEPRQSQGHHTSSVGARCAWEENAKVSRAGLEMLWGGGMEVWGDS